jgi:glycosyltransferase involved in cell wall biosynthesis
MSKLKVALISAWFVPYRIPLLREVSGRKNIDLTAIYCSEIEPGRNWLVPTDLPFKAVFLKYRILFHYTFKNMFGEKSQLRFPLHLFTVLRKVKPNLLVLYEFRIECIMAFLYAFFHKCEYVIWSDVTAFHDSRMGNMRRFIRKLLLSKSKSLIGSSSETINYFHHSFGYPLEKSHLSILSSHIDEFIKIINRSSFSRKKSNDLVRFLYVGRFIPLKGLDLLIEAFSQVKKKFPATSLTLIGEGRERQSLERLVRTLGCENEVIFKEYIPQNELPQEIKQHDVFIYPTRLDTFGLVVAEAVACGLPVICSCWAGAAGDLISDNGLVVNPLNVEELASAMEKLAFRADLRAMMAKASQSILKKHNLTAAVHGFLNGLGISDQ